MKRTLFFVILILLNSSSFSYVSPLERPALIETGEWNEGNFANSMTIKSEDRGLWLITAKISYNLTYQRDTVGSFDAGGKIWTKEFHQSAKKNASGTITAVVENQAENQAKDFLYHSDSGDPVSITVTGSGSNSESSNSQETIDGTLISADIRTDNVSGSAFPGASLYFEYSDENKSFGASLGIKAVGSYNGRMYSGGINYGEWKDYGGDYDNYSISCGGGGDALTDKNCKMSKTSRGYQGSWKESESKQRHTANGPEYTTTVTTVEITVMPYKESDKPVVTLYGCSELAAGEQSNVMASGKPEGGKFRFWVEPGNLFNVEPDGESSANLTGASPGKGTLYVEYTTPEGKINQTSQTASCVKIENYNGGQPIPQIALYDIDGKKLPGIKTVPVDAQPENASELVKFEPADPGVLTAVGVGSKVTLQGLRTGKTNLQAKTNCGESVGPSIEVEMVNCDEETIAKLAEMMKIAQENQKEAMEEIEKITDSEEYKEAADHITKSTLELAEKTALTIASGGKTSGHLHEALEITEAIATMKDLLTSGSSDQLAFNEFSAMMKATGAKALKAIAGVSEVMKAADEFGKNLGKLMGTEIELKGAMDRAENANKQIIEIVRLQKICRSSEQTQGKSEPQKEPTAKSDKPKSTTEPKTDPKQPATSEPSTQGQGNQEPTSEPTADDGTGVSPPPPTTESKQVGLPFEPANCGCNTQKGVKLSAEGFSALQTGMENLGKCVTDFTSGPATNYMKSLNELQTLTVTLEADAKSGPDVLKKNSGDALARLDTIFGSTKSYEKSGNDFYNKFKACPESMKTGMEIFQSVEKITIDSIKTHY